jgi:hypothetical protein
LHFDLIAYRFHFRANEPVYFPKGKAGNILRGAFGLLFREAAEAAGRPHLYDRIFQPSIDGLGDGDAAPESQNGDTAKARPSGLEDPPRPFVFRASHLEGQTLARDTGFYFDFHLFDVRDAPSDILASAFARLGETGIGPVRAKVELAAVDERELRLDLAPRTERIERLRLRFLTPTEFKSAGRTVSRPEFPLVFSRVRDRISTLRALYGPGPLPIDFAAMGERAEGVRMVRCEIARQAADRRSTRTGQQHSIGGITGDVDYEGSLSEFVPFLEAARWTGVGRHTVWGNGELAVAPYDL